MLLRGKGGFRASLAGCSVLVLVWLNGCDDAAKKPVQASAKVPALAPQPTKQAEPVPSENLPLTGYHLPEASLVPHAPGGIDYLIAQVREKFASGEANYKAGHLAAARRDFDDSVDWILESGYDPNSDPKLRDLCTPTSCKPFALVTASRKLQPFRRPSMKWRK